MKEPINEKPFEHRCSHGTVFTALRCDFVDGVTANVPVHLTTREMVEDAVELGAWHWANIMPRLNGFTGPGTFTIYRGTKGEDEARQRVLALPLMEFFSLEALTASQASKGTGLRAFSALKHDSLPAHGRAARIPFTTVGEFVENYSVTELRRTPNLGTVSIALILRHLEDAGLYLKKV